MADVSLHDFQLILMHRLQTLEDSMGLQLANLNAKVDRLHSRMETIEASMRQGVPARRDSTKEHTAEELSPSAAPVVVTVRVEGGRAEVTTHSAPPPSPGAAVALGASLTSQSNGSVANGNDTTASSAAPLSSCSLSKEGEEGNVDDPILSPDSSGWDCAVCGFTNLYARDVCVFCEIPVDYRERWRRESQEGELEDRSAEERPLQLSSSVLGGLLPNPVRPSPPEGLGQNAEEGTSAPSTHPDFEEDARIDAIVRSDLEKMAAMYEEMRRLSKES